MRGRGSLLALMVCLWAAPCSAGVYTADGQIRAGESNTIWWEIPNWAPGSNAFMHYAWKDRAGNETWTSLPGVPMVFETVGSTTKVYRVTIVVPENAVSLRAAFNLDGNWWDNNNGQDYRWQFAAGPEADYVDAFPDWNAAATKIPLGFGFAMSFWAACVAASVAMRWVRDLASAAT